MSNRGRPKQTILPISPECYWEIVAALGLAGAEREVGKAGIQLGRFLFIPVEAIDAEPEPATPQDDALARHRARVLAPNASKKIA